MSDIKPGTLIVSTKIPGLPPSVNSIWKARGRGVYKSQKAKVWQEDARIRLCHACHFKCARYEGAACYLMLVLSKKSGPRRDIDNMTKVVQDSFCYAGLIADDSQIQDFRVVRTQSSGENETVIYLWAGERLPEEEVSGLVNCVG
jgi:Holliday junction resolvase RusA-like endonuclease